MKKTTLKYETKPIEEYQEITDDIFATPLDDEEKDDEKPQLFIGILLIICMAFWIAAIFIPALVPLLIAPLIFMKYTRIFWGKFEQLHKKLEEKLRERFSQE